MEFHDCMSAFKRFSWLIVVMTLVSALSAFAISVYLLAPVYESKAMIIISKKTAGSAVGASQTALLDSNSIRLFYNVAESESVAESVIRSLGLTIPTKDLQDMIDIGVDYDTGIINISARTEQPTLSQSIVTAFINVMSTQTGGGFLDVDIHTVDAPKLPDEPVSPNPVLNAVLSAAGGMSTSMLLAVALGASEQTRTDIHALGKLPSLFVMGFFPRISGLKKNGFHNPADKKAAEAAKAIHANLQMVMERDNIKSVMLTSPRPLEGRTTVAVNVAASMARCRKRVLFIDCCAERPVFYKLGGATGENPYHTVGEHVVKAVSGLGFDAVVAPRDSAGINYSALRTLVDSMEEHYDVILADCPPLMTDADTMMLTSIIRNVLIEADYRLLSHRTLEKCVRRLNQINARVLGVVINRIPAKKLL